MKQNLQIAAKCFGENLALFSDPQGTPEKYNLYNGLANLAGGIQALQAEIERLRPELQQLAAAVRR